MAGFAPYGATPFGALGDTPPDGDGTLTQGVGLGAVVAAQQIVNVTVTQGIGAGATAVGSYGAPTEGVVTEGLVLAPTVEGLIQIAGAELEEITEGLTLNAFAFNARGLSGTITETLEIEETLEALYAAAVIERLRISNPVVANQLLQTTIAQGVRLRDRLTPALLARIAETLGVDPNLSALTAVRVLESLRVRDQVRGAGTFNLTITQAVRLVNQLAAFFGAEAVEGLGLASTLTGRAQAQGRVAEGVGLAGQMVPQLLLRATATDGVRLEQLSVTRLLLNPTIVEGIELAVGYLAPNGSFTTWSMNTRTGAVSEYSDYVFNSFARIGHKYVGASSDGLFELLGDDDDGEDIIARLRGGFMQFGGTRLSRLNAAYIAARGEGDFILRIETADGVVYDYATSTRNMRSTKVHMGKGQRARYFAFELISAGQDFDLDTLEFVPIVVQRRV